jgi:hypothetical protein
VARLRAARLGPNAGAHAEAEYLIWRCATIRRRLAGVAGAGGQAGDPSARHALERARQEAARMDLADRVAVYEREAASVLGAEVVERTVAAALAGRSAWAPPDDFSVTGPFAAPPDVVAERRWIYQGKEPLRGR